MEGEVVVGVVVVYGDDDCMERKLMSSTYIFCISWRASEDWAMRA